MMDKKELNKEARKLGEVQDLIVKMDAAQEAKVALLLRRIDVLERQLEIYSNRNMSYFVFVSERPDLHKSYREFVTEGPGREWVEADGESIEEHLQDLKGQ